MKCPCGYQRFATRRTYTTAEVSRWVLTTVLELDGFGATPYGTSFGATTGGGSYGRYLTTLKTGLNELYCESCKRVRSSSRLGGLGALASYVEDGLLYVVASDVVPPVTCFEVRYTSPDGLVYTVPLSYSPDSPPAVFGEPLETSDTPPDGAVYAATLLVAEIPDVLDSGTYHVDVIDRCAQNTLPLVDLYLEANVQLLHPQDADLAGAPSLWLRDFNVDVPSSAQPAGAPRLTIPFDKCRGVIEYDARIGTLPDAQGWTLGGAGSINDFGVVDGKAMRINTAGASYFTKALTISGAAPTRVHGYMGFLRSNFGSTRGLDFQLMYAANAAAYRGARLNARNANIYKMELDAGSAVALGIPGRSPGWESMGGSATSAAAVAWRDDYAEDAFALYGTNGSAPANEIRCIFGDTNGDALVGYIRNVVVSTGGRFIRPGFAGYAEVAEPVVRLYLSRITDADADLTARFKVTYGQGANPYGTQANTVSLTASMGASNTVYEFPAQLTGLNAQAPFWFTVERDWTHGDDLFDSTVHLHHVTVRSR